MNVLQILVLLWLLMVPCEQRDSASTPAALSALLHDLWHWRTEHNPEFATQVGINDNTAGRLDSLSKSKFEDKKRHCEELLVRANALSSSNLTFTDDVQLRILKAQLDEFVENYNFLDFFQPVTALAGPQLHLRSLVQRKMTLRSYNDFQKLLARFGEFPRQASEILVLMHNNVENGQMPHTLSMSKILDQFSFLGKAVVDSALFSPFLHVPMALPALQRRTLRQHAQERLSQDVMPAFQSIKDYLQHTYLNACRSDTSIQSLNSGKEFYKASLRYYTSTGLSPREIHALGLSELKKLQKNFIEVFDEGDFPVNKTVNEALQFVRTSEHFYYKSQNEFFSDLTDRIDKLKRSRYKIIKQNLSMDNLNIEELASASDFIWYEAASMDGDRPAVIYVRPDAFRLLPKHELGPLSLQLVYPGRHLHSSYLHLSGSIPPFRRVQEAPYWNLAPTELSHWPAFVEGWALYAQSFGESLGIYKTPLDRLAYIGADLSWSSYLVVDTGIHSLHWTLQEAEQFLRNNTYLSDQFIQEVIRRAVSQPGSICAAKVGSLKLQELRRRAESALGTSFKSDEFHSILFECTGPLNVTQICVTNYISEQIFLQGQAIKSETKVIKRQNNENIEKEEKNEVNSAISFNFIKSYRIQLWTINAILIFNCYRL